MRIQPSNPFYLAPMAGITDMPFRRLLKRMGAGCVISEFVSAHAIVLGVKRTQQYLAFHEEERPMGLQIFGGETQILAEAAKIVEARGVDFIDINMGCPAPKVTKKGGGSGWLSDLPEMAKMLQSVRKSIQIPLTIKIRLGWDQNSIVAEEILKIAREEGVELVSIHGRTRTQGYSGLADWNYMQELCSKKIIPIVANGDIISGPLAAARLLQSGADGVMIGRGALKNPWIFKEAVEALDFAKSLNDEAQATYIQSVLEYHKIPPAGHVPDGRHYYERKVKNLQPKPVSFTASWTKIRADRDARALIDTHLSILRETYPEERVMFNIRKFLAWYSAGYPGAHEFRKFIFTHENFDEILGKTYEFFDHVKNLGNSADELREQNPVLMDGHG